MRTIASTLIALVTALPIIGCGSDDEPERRPFRDRWRDVGSFDFVHTAFDDEGDATTLIGDLIVGGLEYNSNFANRGDVIVEFDGPANEISIALRRFTMNTSEQAAQDDFEALELWAFNTNVDSPLKPGDMNADNDCTADGWLPGCGIRVYYDGQSQLARTGADIRVTLPADYRGEVDIRTEDSDEDDDYFNRGDVCVFNTNGAVKVDLQSGEAFVVVSDEATPAPACGAPPNRKSAPSESVAYCDTLEIDGEPAAWSADACSCAMEGEYGVVLVESDAAADITVDVPDGLWAAITVENQGDSSQDCLGAIELDGIVLDDVGNEGSFEAKGTINSPSDAVTAGAGYNIQARSGECNPVLHTDEPGAFAGVNKGHKQTSHQRGNITVCKDCLRESSCDFYVE